MCLSGHVKQLLGDSHFILPFGSKKGGTLCPCINFRRLNEITVKNKYPLLFINSHLSPSTVPQYLLQQIPMVLSHIHPRHHTQLDPHRQILLPPWRE